MENKQRSEKRDGLRRGARMQGSGMKTPDGGAGRIFLFARAEIRDFAWEVCLTVQNEFYKTDTYSILFYQLSTHVGRRRGGKDSDYGECRTRELSESLGIERRRARTWEAANDTRRE